MKKRLAFVFPGQGSQSVGMLDAWGDHPAVREALTEASAALSQDIGALIAHGTKEELSLTTNTQPVMLVAGVAAYRAWLYEGGQEPVVMAGHSLGEYSALVAAGVLTLTQAAPLVRLRAQAMQEAVPVGEGAMAAILGMDAAQVVALCAQVQSDMGAAAVVEAVNFNDPMQTVIAGSKAAVEKACEVIKAAGAKRALPLPVSAPFHSSLMKPAALRLQEHLAAVDLQISRIPVINNIDVAICSQPDDIRSALVRQAAGPVRWVECMQAIAKQEIDAVVECGPGKVLAGMAKRILPDISAAALFDPPSLQEVKGLCA